MIIHNLFHSMTGECKISIRLFFSQKIRGITFTFAPPMLSEYKASWANAFKIILMRISCVLDAQVL